MYSTSLQPEICHVVYLRPKRLLDPLVVPKNTMPYMDKTLNIAIEKRASEHERELPTCPLCLERMDENVTGLLAIMCQHTFHCYCLSKWGDGM